MPSDELDILIVERFEVSRQIIGAYKAFVETSGFPLKLNLRSLDRHVCV
jgi:hypothetical protein